MIRRVTKPIAISTLRMTMPRPAVSENLFEPLKASAVSESLVENTGDLLKPPKKTENENKDIFYLFPEEWKKLREANGKQ